MGKALNEEQAKAQQVVDDSVQELVLTYPQREEYGAAVVSDYALVAFVTSIGTDGERYTSYQMVFPGGETDDHRAVGLFKTGIHLMLSGARVEG